MYKEFIKVGDIVKMNKTGVNCFGDEMYNIPSMVTNVYIDEDDRKECENDNCTCYLRYDIESLENNQKLQQLVFDELDIIMLTNNK